MLSCVVTEVGRWHDIGSVMYSDGKTYEFLAGDASGDGFTVELFGSRGKINSPKRSAILAAYLIPEVRNDLAQQYVDSVAELVIDDNPNADRDTITEEVRRKMNYSRDNGTGFCKRVGNFICRAVSRVYREPTPTPTPTEIATARAEIDNTYLLPEHADAHLPYAAVPEPTPTPTSDPTFQVAASHPDPDYTSALPLTVKTHRYSGSFISGFYATAPGLNCSKVYSSPEEAVRHLMLDHGYRFIVATPVHETPEPIEDCSDMADAPTEEQTTMRILDVPVSETRAKVFLPFTLHFSVTASDIEEGLQVSSSYCPIALAINRAGEKRGLKLYAVVGTDTAHTYCLNGHKSVARLGAAARWLRSAFDAGHPIAPFRSSVTFR